MIRVTFFIFILINSYLWLGLAKDPEFFEWEPFLKARPCPKFLFSSPIGMGDYDQFKLSEREAYEQFMFEQYFYKGGIQYGRFSFKMCDFSTDVLL